METQTTKKCPYCAEEVQLEAKVCKHCKADFKEQAKKDKKEKIQNKVMIGCSIVFILFLMFSQQTCSLPTSSYSSSSYGSSSSSSSKTYETEAFICAKRKVTDLLKSPSSAKFPWYDSSFVKKGSGNNYTVQAYVDADNSFGANIRTNFSCSLNLTSISSCSGSCNLR